MLRVFGFFRDSPLRRAALAAGPGDPGRYSLYGLDRLAPRGFETAHNLERPIPWWAREADTAANWTVKRVGGYGGDFAGVLGPLRRAHRADVIWSTVDTVGLPLVLLGRAGLVRRPVVYTAIGLPERLERLRGERARRLYTEALGRVRAIVAFSGFEADALRDWLGAASPPVEFVPFAVDADYFRPLPERVPDVDVVSIGADPRRDFDLLLGIARHDSALRIRIVATAEQARGLGPVPPNVEIETDIPFGEVRDRLASGRVVALPVRENSYSGATTVLLQALAMGKPVVVSRTRAIETGYDLADGENCRLVPPGEPGAFEDALTGLLRDGSAAAAVGARGRATAESFSWERYAGKMAGILRRAA